MGVGTRRSARSGVSTKVVVILLAILIGLVIGPLQAIYCVMFSGKEVSEHKINVGEEISVPLSPDMNPIRFLAEIDYMVPKIIAGQSESSNFDGTLSYDDSELWSQQFGVSENDDDENGGGTRISITRSERSASKTSSIHSFNVDESGDYHFLATKTKHQELRVNEMHLKIRRNVMQVNLPLTISGGVLMFLGIFTGFILLMTKKSKLATMLEEGSGP